jgi:dTDP-4-amino-4,6-dideoxygalactose transaminase
MHIPLINLQRQFVKLEEELMAAVRTVLAGGQYILGEHCALLEGEVARLSGGKFGIAVANGTDALVLVLRAMGIGTGDEVITSPFTFFASAESISMVGATPVFVDVDPRTYNLNPEELAARISPRTKAIMPVHIFGQPCSPQVYQIAAQAGIYVLEDACQAIGATAGHKPVGSLGDAACYSFFPTKNLGGYGDGGMVVTDNEEFAETIKMLRAHGSKKKYFHLDVGYNSRLDEVQAAMLLVKLKYLEGWTRRRRELAANYDRELSGIVQTPYISPQVSSVYHLYVIRHPRRDQLQAWLREQGIATGIYYPQPLHLQAAYSDLGYGEGDLPQSEAACNEVLALPICPELSDEEQIYVIDKVKEWARRK